MNNILAKNISIGKNSFIDPGAIIKGINGQADEIIIGDNVYIGNHVQIICNNFSIGDYSKIHHHTNIHGYLPCKIGHNAWVGQYTIIDSIGGVTIGNNFGVGAHSQLWSHIKYGDTLEGCRFDESSPLNIGNDVWFVGHCIVSPITAEDKSMALAGSVVTKNMKYNEIYAGSPAKSISEKIGGQFVEVSVDEKYKKMQTYLQDFVSTANQIQIVMSSEEFNYEDNITYFSVSDRTYTKKLSDIEIEFMKFLLPSKAKFIPEIKI
jgi:acetyltransferase-like isoleucine patch superfamily enzyme